MTDTATMKPLEVEWLLCTEDNSNEVLDFLRQPASNEHETIRVTVDRNWHSFPKHRVGNIDGANTFVVGPGDVLVRAFRRLPAESSVMYMLFESMADFEKVFERPRPEPQQGTTMTIRSDGSATFTGSISGGSISGGPITNENVFGYRDMEYREQAMHQCQYGERGLVGLLWGWNCERHPQARHVAQRLVDIGTIEPGRQQIEVERILYGFDLRHKSEAEKAAVLIEAVAMDRVRAEPHTAEDYETPRDVNDMADAPTEKPTDVRNTGAVLADLHHRLTHLLIEPTSHCHVEYNGGVLNALNEVAAEANSHGFGVDPVDPSTFVGDHGEEPDGEPDGEQAGTPLIGNLTITPPTVDMEALSKRLDKFFKGVRKTLREAAEQQGRSGE